MPERLYAGHASRVARRDGQDFGQWQQQRRAEFEEWRANFGKTPRQIGADLRKQVMAEQPQASPVRVERGAVAKAADTASTSARRLQEIVAGRAERERDFRSAHAKAVRARRGWFSTVKEPVKIGRLKPAPLREAEATNKDLFQAARSLATSDGLEELRDSYWHALRDTEALDAITADAHEVLHADAPPAFAPILDRWLGFQKRHNKIRTQAVEEAWALIDVDHLLPTRQDRPLPTAPPPEEPGRPSPATTVPAEITEPHDQPGAPAPPEPAPAAATDRDAAGSAGPTGAAGDARLPCLPKSRNPAILQGRRLQ